MEYSPKLDPNDPIVRTRRHHRAYTVFGGDRRLRKTRYMTPKGLVPDLTAAFGGQIDLDPCWEPASPIVARHTFTKKQNGLNKDWGGCLMFAVYVNPPYGDKKWIYKSIAEAHAGARIIMLLPVRTDAVYHQRLLKAATDFVLIEGRLSFTAAGKKDEDATPAAFGSMLVGLNQSVRALAHLGVLVSPK